MSLIILLLLLYCQFSSLLKMIRDKINLEREELCTETNKQTPPYEISEAQT